jgi:hypothetical protein
MEPINFTILIFSDHIISNQINIKRKFDFVHRQSTPAQFALIIFCPLIYLHFKPFKLYPLFAVTIEKQWFCCTAKKAFFRYPWNDFGSCLHPLCSVAVKSYRVVRDGRGALWRERGNGANRPAACAPARILNVGFSSAARSCRGY